MATDEIRLSDLEALTAQARLHYEIRDFCYQIAGEFESKYQAVASQLQGKQAENYQQWWQALKPHLLKLASQHEQFGHNLEVAHANYKPLDPHITQTFVRGQPR
ncbi:MAG TPA: hypothetical protein VKQ30_14800 [Ktedonobacterales bacterium]|nr:hypothetical protein [Ktedonobacterales bacterium]